VKKSTADILLGLTGGIFVLSSRSGTQNIPDFDLMSQDELKDLILGSEIWNPEGFGVVLHKDNRMIFVTPDYSKLLLSKLAERYPNDKHLPKFKYHGQVDFFPEKSPGSWVVSSLQPLDDIELDSLYVFSAPRYKTEDSDQSKDWFDAVEPHLGEPYQTPYGYMKSDFTFAKFLQRDALVRETIIPESDPIVLDSILVSLSRMVDMAKVENSDVIWDNLINENILVDEDGNLILNDLMVPNTEYSKSFAGLADVFDIG